MGKKLSGNKRGPPVPSNSFNNKAESTKAEAWTKTDHAIRTAKKNIKKQKASDTDKSAERARRSALLTRDSKEKREEGRLRLHIKRVERQIQALRQRLQTWDDEDERKKRQEQLEKEKKEREEEEAGPLNKKRKGRKGPETWQLKGAARPAWQVYDFDVRYVDPHLAAHDAAKQKAKRTRNIFSLCKGRFGDEDTEDVPQPYCREFLSLLMQWGNLSQQAKQLKSARAAFLECMELESTSPHTTTARCQLMKLYLEANRPESARRLWEKLSPDDPSVWIRYSAALIEYVSWKLLEEAGSTEESARTLLTQAIQSNVFCAYYLAFWTSFEGVLEHGEEIEGANEDQPLEEAIEYCNSEEGYGAWQGTDGALDWIRDVIVSTLHGGSAFGLSPKDLAWKEKLSAIKEEYEENTKPSHASSDDQEDEPDAEDEKQDSEEDADDDETEVDGAMFADMFGVAMEMLEDSGKIKVPP